MKWNVERKGVGGLGEAERAAEKGGGGGAKREIRMFQNLDYVSGIQVVCSRNCIIPDEQRA